MVDSAVESGVCSLMGQRALRRLPAPDAGRRQLGTLLPRDAQSEIARRPLARSERNSDRPNAHTLHQATREGRLSNRYRVDPDPRRSVSSQRAYPGPPAAAVVGSAICPAGNAVPIPASFDEAHLAPSTRPPSRPARLAAVPRWQRWNCAAFAVCRPQRSYAVRRVRLPRPGAKDCQRRGRGSIGSAWLSATLPVSL